MPAPVTSWDEIVDQAMADCTDVFGEGTEQVTVQHVGGTQYQVDGIFEAESIDVDPETGARVISNNPQISFRLSVLEDDPDNLDTITIRGVEYRVKEPIFDGHGTVTLRLWRK